jgi:hypothetical protein
MFSKCGGENLTKRKNALFSVKCLITKKTPKKKHGIISF